MNILYYVTVHAKRLYKLAKIQDINFVDLPLVSFPVIMAHYIAHIISELWLLLYKNTTLTKRQFYMPEILIIF